VLQCWKILCQPRYYFFENMVVCNFVSEHDANLFINIVFRRILLKNGQIWQPRYLQLVSEYNCHVRRWTSIYHFFNCTRCNPCEILVIRAIVCYNFLKERQRKSEFCGKSKINIKNWEIFESTSEFMTLSVKLREETFILYLSKTNLMGSTAVGSFYVPSTRKNNEVRSRCVLNI